MTTARVTILLDWLLALDRESGSETRALFVRTMVDNVALLAVGFLWTQGSWLGVYLCTGWSWLGIVSLVDGLLFLKKLHFRRMLDRGMEAQAPLPVGAIVTTNILFSLLLGVEVAVLLSIPSSRTLVVGLSMAIAYNGYVSVLYASFPRLAFIHYVAPASALTFGLATSFLPEVHLMAPTAPVLAICFAILTKRSHSSLKEAIFAQQLHFEQSRHDVLTGLANRLLMVERLNDLCSGAAKNTEATFAVVCLDLDGFKAVNDRHGHAAGDEVLVQVARRLQGAVRTTDTVARFGGDEYVLLLPGADGVVAQAIVERVIVAVAEPMAIGPGAIVRIGISAGVACYGVHAVEPEALLMQGDKALYETKGERRDRYRLAG